jgi:predicted RNA binding protein YcfA (HicA-like mRNA interferase family)
MGYVPQVSGKEVVRALEKLGYDFDVQHGSHMILRHSLPPYRRITVPNHKPVAKGTLRQIIKDAGLTMDEFKNLL